MYETLSDGRIVPKQTNNLWLTELTHKDSGDVVVLLIGYHYLNLFNSRQEAIDYCNECNLSVDIPPAW